jgi:hypothetical protein
LRGYGNVSAAGGFSMFPDALLFGAWILLALFIALPALSAWRRRTRSREASEIAARLVDLAGEIRRNAQTLPLDASLKHRIERLMLHEANSLMLSEELGAGGQEMQADAAQRLALRLKRRVAFERKMLARTASGLRRGALAALVPPAMVLVLHAVGWEMPGGAQMLLWLVELGGCTLLWRIARVEI